MGEWSNRNHPAHLRVMSRRYRLTGTMDNPLSPISTEVRNTEKKPSQEPETETDFQVWCIDLEGYTFDLGPIALETSARTMKELERYLGEK